MIFVTVGSGIPFDRLVRAVDKWARANDRRDVFAQIGRGGWEPEFIPFVAMLEPAEFKERLAASSIVVAHAGMGTILSAMQDSKPILVMPRRGHLGETRNDHQMATARYLLAMDRVNVAFEEEELHRCLDRLGELVAKERISPFAGVELTGKLHDYIHQGITPMLGKR
jgi:UDP-N-acetylglucosamine transferase subunit ALG13